MMDLAVFEEEPAPTIMIEAISVYMHVVKNCQAK
jgi:hypothetical protein